MLTSPALASLRWTGPRPPPAVRRALAAAGFAPGAGEAAVAAVIATKDARSVPAPPPDGLPWLWLCDREVPSGPAAGAFLRGAVDVIPVRAPDAAARLVSRLRELATVEPTPPGDAPELVAAGESSRRMRAQLARAARTSMPVLLTGETGTGKDVAARLIHAWSSRAERRFVPINCAAIPNELMEAELFGYARGAFSGAVHAYEGQLGAAEGGTVFLDEIDDTPLALQTKLLRVLEDRVVSRLGENLWRKVDFRLLAATNRDLPGLIRAGQFGDDLFQRLSIVSIHLAPLRERIDELPMLATHFLARFYDEEPEARARHDVGSLRADALRALEAYPWPGNVRELRNVIYEALVHKRAGAELLPSDLPRRVLSRGVATPGALVERAAVARRIEQGQLNLLQELEALERIALQEALARSGGNAVQAARLLGQVGRGASSDPGGTVRAMARRLGVPLRQGPG